jgi:hypothetical protein
MKEIYRLLRYDADLFVTYGCWIYFADIFQQIFRMFV